MKSFMNLIAIIVIIPCALLGMEAPISLKPTQEKVPLFTDFLPKDLVQELNKFIVGHTVQESSASQIPSLFLNILTIKPRTSKIIRPYSYAKLFDSENNRLILSNDTDIEIWDLKVPKFHTVTRLQGHTKSISCLIFGKDTNSLISASEDGTIKIWDLNKKECIQTLAIPGLNAVKLLYHPEKKQLYSVCNRHKRVDLWDTITGKHLQASHSLELFDNFICFVRLKEYQFSRRPKDSEAILLISKDGYHIAFSPDLQVYEGQFSSNSIFKPQSNYYYDLSKDKLYYHHANVLHIFHTKNFPRRDPRRDKNPIKISTDATVITYGNNMLFYADKNGHIFALDLVQKKEIPLLSKVYLPIDTLIFNENTNQLLAHSIDGTFCIWDFNNLPTFDYILLSQALYEHFRKGTKLNIATDKRYLDIYNTLTPKQKRALEPFIISQESAKTMQSNSEDTSTFALIIAAGMHLFF